MSHPDPMEHQRARHAFSVIKKYEGNGEQYKSVVQSAPNLLHSAGLLQVLAFYHSRKEGRAEHELCGHLLDWISSGSELTKPIFADNHDGPFHKLLKFNVDHVALCEEEALHYVAWLKQFAAARWRKKQAAATAPEGAGRKEGK